MNALTPGDELVLRGGTYALASLFTIQSQGTVDAPIVIRAKAGEVPIIQQTPSQNVINIQNAQYLVLRGLTITGGQTGVRLTTSSFVTVEDCHIHHTGNGGIAANVPGSNYQGLRLRRNHVHDTNGSGEGLYLGCNSAACKVFDSQVRRNYIHHTNGAGVLLGEGIKVKEGSYNNVVRDNVVHDTLGVCLVLGGTARRAPNLVEGNFLRLCGDHGLQAAADARIRNNLVLASGVNGIHLGPIAPSSPANLTVTHNTVIQTNAGTSAVRAVGVVGPVVITNNALFNAAGNAIQVPVATPSVIVTGNAGVGGLSGTAVGFDGSGDLATDLVDADYSALLPQDMSPAAGSLLLDAGNVLYAARRDFEWAPRSEAVDIGAYRFLDGRVPAWVLAAAGKPPMRPRRRTIAY